MTTLCIILFVIGVFLWYKTAKLYTTPINHVNLFSLTWLSILIGSIFFTLDFVVMPKTYLILIGSWIFFLLGSLRLKSAKDIEPVPIDYNLKRVKIILYVLIVLSFFAYLSSLGDIIYRITDINEWASLRSEQTFAEATSENIFYTLFARNYSIYMPIAIFLFLKGELNKKIFYLIFIYGLITSIINFSRGPLLEFVLVSFVSYMLIKRTKNIPIIKVLLVIIGFVLIFSYSQSVLFSLNEYSVFDANYQVKMYLFGGVNNYQLILDGLYPDNNVYSSPFYSFDFINYILKKMEIINSYPNQVREFNDFTDSNVYTYLDAFTLDFGILGAFLGSFLIGFICKKIYFCYEKYRSILYLIIYSLLCCFSVFTFINNEYIRFSFLLFVIKIFIIEKIIKMPRFVYYNKQDINQ